MDVRKKFALSIAVLTVIVITLSILVYLSATKTPFREEENLPPFDSELPESETLPETNTQNTEGAAQEQVTEEKVSNIIATITLEDSQTPEKQLTQTGETTTDIKENETVYTLRMYSSWSEQLHPKFHPDGSHLSPMVVWSHGMKNTLFRSGGIASEGMEVMAETGGTKEITKEIRSYIAGGGIFSYAADKGPLFTPGERTVQIKTSKKAPYVTVVSMIAPSPDWFITARNVKLYENRRWLEQVNIPAILYDAGTDSGTTFTAEDKDTNPKKSIKRIKNTPPIPIATFEFTRN